LVDQVQLTLQVVGHGSGRLTTVRPFKCRQLRLLGREQFPHPGDVGAKGDRIIARVWQ
jgi:hypothetical protein